MADRKGGPEALCLEKLKILYCSGDNTKIKEMSMDLPKMHPQARCQIVMVSLN